MLVVVTKVVVDPSAGRRKVAFLDVGVLELQARVFRGGGRVLLKEAGSRWAKGRGALHMWGLGAGPQPARMLLVEGKNSKLLYSSGRGAARAARNPSLGEGRGG